MSGQSDSDPRRPTRRQVLERTKSGESPREIATGLGISVQRVYQHLDRLRADGELSTEGVA